jgi:uncharacterized lipoprotein YddW (UPF0748 family)
MNPEILYQMVALARQIGHVLVATADAQGLPHIAPAEKMTLIPEEKKITVEAWFCPGTVANLQSNRQMAVVAWDPKTDKGYQILGKAEGVEDVILLDGFVPGLQSMLPQEKKRLIIRVERLMAFRQAPHTDEEE